MLPLARDFSEDGSILVLQHTFQKSEKFNLKRFSVIEYWLFVLNTSKENKSRKEMNDIVCEEFIYNVARYASQITDVKYSARILDITF